MKDAVKQMQAVADGSFFEGEWYDREEQHKQADKILCDALTSLGHEDLVKAWEAVPKWYS